MHLYIFRALVFAAQELREENVESIRAVRRAHKQQFSDPGGYDLITLPEVRMDHCDNSLGVCVRLICNSVRKALVATALSLVSLYHTYAAG